MANALKYDDSFESFRQQSFTCTKRRLCQLMKQHDQLRLLHVVRIATSNEIEREEIDVFDLLEHNYPHLQ